MILVIGPKKRKNSNNIGGVVVSFDQFVNYLGLKNIYLIDINFLNYKNKVIGFISVLYQTFKYIRKCKYVSFHSTATTFYILGPLLIIICKIHKRKIVIRKFAGNFKDIYLKSSYIKRFLIRYVVKNSDYVFFQTKMLVSYFQRFSPNVHWFPTIRKRSYTPIIPRKYNKRFVFISQVKETKGINEIIEVSKKLSSDYLLEIFGPIVDNYYEERFSFQFQKLYKGSLEHHEVINKLNEYDVLLLPTYHEGEGYPGIIIEAYSLGIPVISTYWNSIPEIVEDNITGRLVKPKSVDLLLNAIKSFNKENYQTMSINAYKTFEQFDADKQMERIFNIIESSS